MAWLSWSDRTKKKRMLYIMEERKITRMLFMDFLFCLAEVFYSFKELSSLSYFLPSIIVIQHDNRIASYEIASVLVLRHQEEVRAKRTPVISRPEVDVEESAKF